MEFDLSVFNWPYFYSSDALYLSFLVCVMKKEKPTEVICFRVLLVFLITFYSCMNIGVFFLMFFSITVYPRRVDIVPCAI